MLPVSWSMLVVIDTALLNTYLPAEIGGSVPEEKSRGRSTDVPACSKNVRKSKSNITFTELVNDAQLYYGERACALPMAMM